MNVQYHGCAEKAERVGVGNMDKTLMIDGLHSYGAFNRESA